jgi:hypothetical protein
MYKIQTYSQDISWKIKLAQMEEFSEDFETEEEIEISDSDLEKYEGYVETLENLSLGSIFSLLSSFLSRNKVTDLTKEAGIISSGISWVISRIPYFKTFSRVVIIAIALKNFISSLSGLSITEKAKKLFKMFWDLKGVTIDVIQSLFYILFSMGTAAIPLDDIITLFALIPNEIGDIFNRMVQHKYITEKEFISLANKIPFLTVDHVREVLLSDEQELKQLENKESVPEKEEVIEEAKEEIKETDVDKMSEKLKEVKRKRRKKKDDMTTLEQGGTIPLDFDNDIDDVFASILEKNLIKAANYFDEVGNIKLANKIDSCLLSK